MSQQTGRPAVCPNGHAMDDGLFHCPACGAYRPSAHAKPDAELSWLREDLRRAGEQMKRYENERDR